MSIQPNEMDYPLERIRAMKTWKYFQGFTGARCGRCGKRANVPYCPPVWMCQCWTFNAHCAQCEPFEKPDYGPTRAVIQEACDG